MIRLLLVRHGETDWNVVGRHQGQSDIPLNKNGQQQANRVAERLKYESLDLIYASDLIRAWETAEMIANRHAIELIREPLFREMCFGDWEGLTYDEIFKQQKMTPHAWNQFMLETGPPGGESITLFANRIRSGIDNILHIHPDKTVLIVAHGGTLMMLACLLLDHPIKKYWQFRMLPASVSEISVYEEDAILNLLNDTSHLLS